MTGNSNKCVKVSCGDVFFFFNRADYNVFFSKEHFIQLSLTVAKDYLAYGKIQPVQDSVLPQLTIVRTNHFLFPVSPTAFAKKSPVTGPGNGHSFCFSLSHTPRAIANHLRVE